MSLPSHQPYTSQTGRGIVLRRLGIRVGIPILLFVVVFLGAFLLGKEEYLLAAGLLAIPLLILGVELALHNQKHFPLIILMTALFVPFSFSTGRSTPLVLSLVLASGFTFLWIIQMLMEREFRIRYSPVNTPVYLFSATVLTSLAWSMIFRDPQMFTWGSFPLVQAASAVLMIISVATVLLTGNLVTDEKQLKWMVGIFIAAGFLGIVDNFLPFVKLPVNTRGLFAMWLVAFTTSLAFFNRKMPGWLRISIFLLGLVWIYWGYGVNIEWLAGWIPLFAVFLMVGTFKSPKVSLALILVVILLVIISWNYLNEAINLENRISGTTRLAAWKLNWQITKQHWLFGTGPAGYAIYYMTYFPTQAMATHNNFLDMLAQTGIVGFIFMMWLFISLVWMGWQLLRRVRGRGDFIEALAVACLAGTLGGLLMMMFGDWLFPFAYTQSIAGFDYSVFNWIFMGVILSLDKIIPRKEVESHA